MRQRLPVLAVVLAVLTLVVVASIAPRARFSSGPSGLPRSVVLPGNDGGSDAIRPGPARSDAVGEPALDRAEFRDRRIEAIREGKRPTLREPFRRSARPIAAPRAEADTLIVHFVEGTSVADQRASIADAGAEIGRTVEAIDVVLVRTRADDRDRVAGVLRDDERVELVERNHILTVAEHPNDELYFSQFHLANSRFSSAWDLTHGSASVDIAIVDTGVDLAHPDLTGRIVAGTDFVNNDSSAQDDMGHGTAVAGVAAAATNNGVGIAGAAYNARIIPVKVMDANGGGSELNIAAGITWAADHGAEVINLSLGGFTDSQAVRDAVAYAQAPAQNSVVVAATGNEGVATPSYPSSYPGVIGVGAADDFGDVAYFSNRGSSVDLIAQGYGVLSTCLTSSGACIAELDNDYGVSDGTSFSAPIVSGVVAMIRTRFPSLSLAQIEQRLRDTAIDRGPPGIDDFYGAGLLDAYAAVGGRTAASPPQVPRDALEPDDTSARAKAPAGSRTIAPEGDVDWTFVDASGPGTISVTVTPHADEDPLLSQTFDPIISAWSPDGDAMGTLDARPPTEAETMTLSVGAAGRYRFRIANFGSSRSGGYGPDVFPYTVTGTFTAGTGTSAGGARIWVTDTNPAPFERGAAAGVQPTVTLGRDVTPESVTSTTVSLRDAHTGSAIAAPVAYNAAADTITLVPSAALAAGKSYVLRVTGLVDVSTNTMSEVFESRFTVLAPTPSSEPTSDFNGDGKDDLAFGAPGESLGSKASAGAVHVLYGGASGTRTTGDQLWTQNSKGIAGAAETGDRFGDKVASGDLNNDGYDDLVVGASYEDTSKKDAGAVHVILGSASGLRASGSQLWTQDSSGVPGAAETGDRFGAALAVGRFDNVAGADVAIGSPGEAIGSKAKAGSVHVLRGASGGLTGSGAQQWTQDSTGIELISNANEKFGASLAAGDMQGDGNDDLAIGAPGDVIVQGGEGSVAVLFGSVTGLHPDIPWFDLFTDDLEPNEAFGTSVTIGDVGGFAAIDGYDDLVMGIPNQLDGSKANAGAVGITYSNHAINGIWGDTLSQSSAGGGTTETAARYGTSLDAHSVASKGVLVAGIPYDDVSSRSDAGSAIVYTSGPTSFGFFGPATAKAYNQNTTGVPGSAEAGDRLGWSVAVVDVDGDGKADVAAGAPYEGLGSAPSAGAMYVIRDATGSAKHAMFTQNSSGILGTAEKSDRFGWSLP